MKGFVRFILNAVSRSKRGRIFVITYLAYALIYATRKPFSVVKTQVQNDLGLSTSWLGAIDTCFLAAYALGQLILPPLLIKRSNAPLLLFLLYAGSGIAALAFGLSSSATAFSLLWVTNGLLHSTVFPIMVGCITPHFSAAARGRVMGSWTTSQQFGAIGATTLSSFLAQRHGWRSVFIIPGVITLVSSFIISSTLSQAFKVSGPLDTIDAASVEPRKISDPRSLELSKVALADARNINDVTLTIELATRRQQNQDPQGSHCCPPIASDPSKEIALRLKPSPSQSDTQSTKASSSPSIMDPPGEEVNGTRECDSGITSPGLSPKHHSERNWGLDTLVTVLMTADVKEVSVSYFCIKWIRYSLLFWLPYYFATELGYSAESAGYASLVFDIGGVLGGILAGFIADRLFRGKRVLVSLLCCFCTSAALVLFCLSAHTNPVVALILMAAVGVAVAGADSLVGGSLSSDLCDRAGHGPATLSAASGIINGCGSVGAVFQGYATAKISQRFGWSALYTFLSVTAMSGAIALCRPVAHEWQCRNRTVTCVA